MRITDVRTMRLVGPDAHGIGGRPRQISLRLVRIDTDAGISGFGETPDFLGDRDGIAYARAWLLGRDPFEITPFVRAMLYGALPTPGGPPAAPSIMSPTATTTGAAVWSASGIEMALCDIAGKALGTPVYTLLGGSYRRRIRIYIDRSGVADPTDLDSWRALGARARDEGFDFMKVDLEQIAPELTRDAWSRSLGNHQIATIAARVAAVRVGAGAEVEIALDGHMCFDVESSIRAARALEPSGLRWFEDPVPIVSATALAHVRAESPIPICAGEMFVAEQFRLFLEAGAVDIVHPDLLFVGGIHEARKVADLADLHYVPLALHNNGGGVTTVAAAHVAAASPNFLGLEYHFAGAPWAAQVVRRAGGRPLIDEGHLTLGDEPGLGIDLDADVCRRYLAPGEVSFLD
jgi:galactonate dehydratase